MEGVERIPFGERLILFSVSVGRFTIGVLISGKASAVLDIDVNSFAGLPRGPFELKTGRKKRQLIASSIVFFLTALSIERS